ncbi:MAG: hypothetical protein P4M13_05985 [Alphaproteobacteria bacterium]|nr:hypothetical protein [Alphaproteobacteria bacterium]
MSNIIKDTYKKLSIHMTQRRLKALDNTIDPKKQFRLVIKLGLLKDVKALAQKGTLKRYIPQTNNLIINYESWKKRMGDLSVEYKENFFASPFHSILRYEFLVSNGDNVVFQHSITDGEEDEDMLIPKPVHESKETIVMGKWFSAIRNEAAALRRANALTKHL